LPLTLNDLFPFVHWGRFLKNYVVINSYTIITIKERIPREITQKGGNGNQTGYKGTTLKK
jgi:hypothetical protein